MAKFKQHQLMSSGMRAVLISGIAAGIGLVLGAALGVALFATGVFAPFGAGILAGVALAATVGGGAALVAGLLGFAAAKVKQNTEVINTLLDTSEEINEDSSLSIMARGLGPKVEPTFEPVSDLRDESQNETDLSIVPESINTMDEQYEERKHSLR